MITPVITGVSGGLALIAVFLRIYDQYDHLQIGDVTAVGSMVSYLQTCVFLSVIEANDSFLCCRFSPYRWEHWSSSVRLSARDHNGIESVLKATTVSHLGFGKDIWVLPFDNITKIIQVRFLLYPPETPENIGLNINSHDSIPG